MDLLELDLRQNVELCWSVGDQGRWTKTVAGEVGCLAHLILARLGHDSELTASLRNGGAGRVRLGVRSNPEAAVEVLTAEMVCAIFARDKQLHDKVVGALQKLFPG